MAYPKRVASQIHKIEDSAISLYEAGLITCFKAKVPKVYSYEEVLKGEAENGDNIKWLKKVYDRLCDFAEEARLKQMPNKLEGTGEGGAFKLQIEIVDHENNASQVPGNRISQFIEI